ncbi:MAG TPA: S8/S53 family peptidase [Pseudonocardiaceae bacterium]
MAAQPLRLTEVLDRMRPYSHSLVLHDQDGPAESLVHAGELLAPAASAAAAVERLGSRVDRVVHGAAVARLMLRPDVRRRCVELAADLPVGLDVAPHHVHLGAPVMFGTPELCAQTGPAVPGPPAELWQPAVTVALLDTGLDPHPWFAGRPWLSEWGLSPEVLDPECVRDRDRQAGHGTFVAGVLLRHAPGVTVRHHRSLSSAGLTDDLTVAAAFGELRRQAEAHRSTIDVIVVTAGCHTVADRCPPVLRQEIGRWPDTVVVAAAGNNGADRPFWPAALPEVLAVGATGSDGTLAAFSNRGDWVDTAAPGVEVVSSYVRLMPAEEGVAPGTTTRLYGTARWSGTSFAAPRIAADVARLRHDGLPASAARAMVRRPLVRANT